MALDQPQPRAGTQPHDDARMAHERRRLADGQEQQLQRVLGVGTVVELDPGAGTGEGAVERGEGAVVLDRGQDVARPARGSICSARGRLMIRTPRGRLCTWLSSGTMWPLTKISRRALWPPSEIGRDRVQADLGPGRQRQRHVGRLDDVGVLPVLGPAGRDALLDEAGIGCAPPVAQIRAGQLALGVGEDGAEGRQAARPRCGRAPWPQAPARCSANSLPSTPA